MRSDEMAEDAREDLLVAPNFPGIKLKPRLPTRTGRPVEVSARGATFKGADHGGAMVAIRIPLDVARRIAIPGGEPPEDLHVTLAYFGAADELAPEQRQALHDALSAVAENTPPFDATITGYGRFRTDDEDVLWVGFDAAELPALRHAVVQYARDAGVELAGDHGYTAHVTTAYVKHGEGEDVMPEPVKLRVDFVSLSLGGTEVMMRLRGALEDAVKAEWDESEHPRDEDGKFGAGAVHTTPVPLSDGDGWEIKVGDTAATVGMRASASNKDKDVLFVHDLHSMKPDSGGTRRLLHAVRDFAREQGATWIEADAANQKIMRLFNRLGATYVDPLAPMPRYRISVASVVNKDDGEAAEPLPPETFSILQKPVAPPIDDSESLDYWAQNKGDLLVRAVPDGVACVIVKKGRDVAIAVDGVPAGEADGVEDLRVAMGRIARDYVIDGTLALADGAAVFAPMDLLALDGDLTARSAVERWELLRLVVPEAGGHVVVPMQVHCAADTELAAAIDAALSPDGDGLAIAGALVVRAGSAYEHGPSNELAYFRKAYNESDHPRGEGGRWASDGSALVTPELRETFRRWTDSARTRRDARAEVTALVRETSSGGLLASLRPDAEFIYRGGSVKVDTAQSWTTDPELAATFGEISRLRVTDDVGALDVGKIDNRGNSESEVVAVVPKGRLRAIEAVDYDDIKKDAFTTAGAAGIIAPQQGTFRRPRRGDSGIEKVWDEAEHPRDDDGKFGEGGGRSRDRDEGGRWSFHGTSKKRVKAILQEGLKSSKAGDMYHGSQKGHVYMASSEGLALSYANEAASRENSLPVILRIQIPTNVLSDISPDPEVYRVEGWGENLPAQMLLKGDIRPEWIKGAWVARKKWSQATNIANLPSTDHEGSKWNQLKSAILTTWVGIAVDADDENASVALTLVRTRSQEYAVKVGWDEGEHPRDEDGRFGAGGDGTANPPRPDASPSRGGDWPSGATVPRGTTVFRGSRAGNEGASTSFPGAVYVSVDRPTAEQWGDVDEWSLTSDVRLLDLDNWNGDAKNLVARAGGVTVSGMSKPDYDEIAANLFIQGFEPAQQQALRRLKYDGARFGKDALLLGKLTDHAERRLKITVAKEDGDSTGAPAFGSHTFVVGDLEDGEVVPRRRRANPYEALFLSAPRSFPRAEGDEYTALARVAKAGNAVAIDFDGTCTVNEDGTANPKVRLLVEALVARGVPVVVFTARDTGEVREWLDANGWPELEVTNVKSPDFSVMLDDRAVNFDPATTLRGGVEGLAGQLAGFKTWWETATSPPAVPREGALVQDAFDELVEAAPDPLPPPPPPPDPADVARAVAAEAVASVTAVARDVLASVKSLVDLMAAERQPRVRATEKPPMMEPRPTRSRKDVVRDGRVIATVVETLEYD